MRNAGPTDVAQVRTADRIIRLVWRFHRAISAMQPGHRKITSREVSDGVTAPGYEPNALDVLGKYCALQVSLLLHSRQTSFTDDAQAQMDPAHSPSEIETCQVYGISIQQRRNDTKIDAAFFANVVGENKEATLSRTLQFTNDDPQLPAQALTDLLVATLALKYTQSSSIGDYMPRTV